ncbi:hypothetical protein EVAR_84606_1 [Eumeta japonica]|uniref:Uncharacterized protein n=1 Tax=Eumeta variegata TaxID=151549 RepID=A0A4C1UZQ1_EUMVA|nr:hypothetical protein EVAR_84606_1 [Eumeta japonica]
MNFARRRDRGRNDVTIQCSAKFIVKQAVIDACPAVVDCCSYIMDCIEFETDNERIDFNSSRVIANAPCLGVKPSVTDVVITLMTTVVINPRHTLGRGGLKVPRFEMRRLREGCASAVGRSRLDTKI